MSTPAVPRATVAAPSGSPARAKVLAAATRLFYAEGIHTVGVDRIVTEAGVTRATFYRHFPSKEDLVRAYIEQWDARVRAEAEAVTAELTPVQVVGLLVTRLGQEMCGRGFRGCPFINAAAEYPDPEHPVSRAIAAHRDWLRALFVRLLVGLGVAEPERRAEVLVMLRDGAMVGAALGDPAVAAERLGEAVSALVASAA
ncbi:TetR/AcrR family transcriptional regulator [Kitasatospora sp. LaBMicrA B282]|uniref:TetR/AcrR family transcriptional regulator n=1 Tax=Kitasatospora sp. LaBMicrA B282 TaxID=3420949 RepID=UPI003D124FDC